MENNSARLILALVACTVLIVVWQSFFAPKPSQVVAPQQQEVSTENNTESVVVDVVPETAPQVVSEPPLVINLENHTIAFDKNSGDIRFVSMDAYINEAEKAPTFVIPDSFKSYAVFSAGVSGNYSHYVEEDGDKVVVTFVGKNEQLKVTKRYVLQKNSYQVLMDFFAENLTSHALSVPMSVTLGPGLGEGFDKSSYVYTGPIIYDGKNLEKRALGKEVKKPYVLDKPLWGAYVSKYFDFAIITNGFNKAEILKYDDKSSVMIMSKIATVQPGAQEAIPGLTLYIGPKLYDDLKSYNVGLHKTMDYGMFFFLAIPMTKILEWTYKFVHNYGISIIILTIIIKLIMLPLTHKSMVSMRAMSKLQPEMVKLREKYKGEPQKLQAATMELYREHKINPLSGCLPLLLQLPIFFALYRSLLVNIQLKGAPFFGWIVDLSAKDPLFITPILMGLSMFLQQKMTPTTADPMQQKIFMFMPIIFTFLFLQFPSGLVIYWLTNNILSIAQQYVINKRIN